MTRTEGIRLPVSPWNVPNALTALRLVLVPPFVWLMLVPDGVGWRRAALGVFIVASFTDWLDGHLARAYDQGTKFGEIADPIADKALTGAAMICLSALGELWWWVTVLVLAREVGITILRYPLDRRGADISAGMAGKAKTALQIFALTVFIAPKDNTLPFLAMGGAVVATLWSGAIVVREAWPILRRPPAGGDPR
ncbi:MAG: CDP-diacylglycerol--glycerol-3-phosphate 3-phosphatidyltransferase [Streptosporangiaceae bacterium]